MRDAPEKKKAAPHGRGDGQFSLLVKAALSYLRGCAA